MEKKSLWLGGAFILLLALFIAWGVVSTRTPEPIAVSEIPLDVAEDDWVIGNENAAVTLVEYLDFECPSCAAYHPIIKEFEKEFGDDLRIVTRYYPLPSHKNSIEAALVAEAAGQQGKFWEMQEILFESQREWGAKQSADAKLFLPYAEKLGLDMDRFKNDRENDATRARVLRDKAAGDALKITGTPSFFLNGEKLQNPRTVEDFKTLIRAEILKSSAAKQSAEKPVLGEKVHEHADIAVYLNGKKMDLTQAKYQSTEANPLDPDAHLHDGNETVLHKHRKGVTLDTFFQSFGMNFDRDCFTSDDATRFCTEGDKTLKLLVNGKLVEQAGDYEFTDLDRILISYGNENQEQLATQGASLTDAACLYSEKCPERGKAPTENCVGGLGTEC
jgi:protein-disulfide isomerase